MSFQPLANLSTAGKNDDIVLRRISKLKKVKCDFPKDDYTMHLYNSQKNRSPPPSCSDQSNNRPNNIIAKSGYSNNFTRDNGDFRARVAFSPRFGEESRHDLSSSYSSILSDPPTLSKNRVAAKSSANQSPPSALLLSDQPIPACTSHNDMNNLLTPTRTLSHSYPQTTDIDAHLDTFLAENGETPQVEDLKKGDGVHGTHSSGENESDSCKTTHANIELQSLHASRMERRLNTSKDKQSSLSPLKMLLSATESTSLVKSKRSSTQSSSPNAQKLTREEPRAPYLGEEPNLLNNHASNVFSNISDEADAAHMGGRDFNGADSVLSRESEQKSLPEEHVIQQKSIFFFDSPQGEGGERLKEGGKQKGQEERISSDLYSEDEFRLLTCFFQDVGEGIRSKREMRGIHYPRPSTDLEPLSLNVALIEDKPKEGSVRSVPNTRGVNLAWNGFSRSRSRERLKQLDDERKSWKSPIDLDGEKFLLSLPPRLRTHYDSLNSRPQSVERTDTKNVLNNILNSFYAEEKKRKKVSRDREREKEVVNNVRENTLRIECPRSNGRAGSRRAVESKKPPLPSVMKKSLTASKTVQTKRPEENAKTQSISVRNVPTEQRLVGRSSSFERSNDCATYASLHQQSREKSNSYHGIFLQSKKSSQDHIQPLPFSATLSSSPQMIPIPSFPPPSQEISEERSRGGLILSIPTDRRLSGPLTRVSEGNLVRERGRESESLNDAEILKICFP